MKRKKNYRTSIKYKSIDQKNNMGRIRPKMLIIISAIIFCILATLILIVTKKEPNIKFLEYEHMKPAYANSIDVSTTNQDKIELNHETINPIPTIEAKTIVIDPGHGGYDPGSISVSGEVSESNVNLAISLFLKEELLDMGFNIIMTREDDSGINLTNRGALLKTYTADMLVSIHQNSLDNDTLTNGIETWYNDLMNENSIKLAELIQEEVIAYSSAKNRGIKLSNGLVVLKSVEFPACLVETGFLSSTMEIEKLKTEEYQRLLAKGIASAIKRYWEEN